uniref:Uncharacterized protein n=1 Tax=Avena sativa TaxID=4498 RepID=A0ACD5UFL5_AVESA
MEELPSSTVDDTLVRGTKDCEQRRRSIAPPDAAAAAAAGWSGLPDDLLIMAALDVPSLIRSGAVCRSWRDACNTFPLPALKQAPCLLYACDEYGPSDAALYCPSVDATFRIPFPGPPHHKRGFVFSCNGWVFAADEVGNPYLFNPITGVHATLPSVKTIMGRDEDDDHYYDDEGKHVVFDGVSRIGVIWARHEAYVRVAISSAAEVAACTVVIVHPPEHRLSFARPGDKTWTLLPDDIRLVSDVLYNEKDGLFYILHSRGSISTLDLISGPSPSVATIMGNVVRGSVADMYIALMPSGELLQVWRMRDLVGTPLKCRWAYRDIRRYVLQDCIDFATENDNNKPTNLQANDDQDDEPSDAEKDDQVSTHKLLVFMVNFETQKLVELGDIGDHAIFLGFNAAVCLPTKDLSPLEPNHAYMTDDCSVYGPMLRKDLCIWNINKRSIQNIMDAWTIMHSWLDLPAPIWIAKVLDSSMEKRY